MCLDSESKTRLTSLNADGPFAEGARRKKERTTKLVKITFKVDYKLLTDAQKYFEQLKYFDKIINDYLTQMIPPCTILQVYINHG